MNHEATGADGAGRPARRVPTATYRVQLTTDFGFDDAARLVPYLDRLGVSHLYLSPILRAVPGSRHGYDVVDPTAVSDELGGAAGLDRLVAALHGRGMGAIADIVPNHMGLPVPESGSPALWSVLREGRASPYARWFDIAWTPGDGAGTPDRLTLPVLGRHLAECLRDGELAVDTSGDEPVLRYYDHVLPLAAGTAGLPLPALLTRQHYRLAYWRSAAERYGYRRFFDITTLMAVRVEDPEVFAATHGPILDLVGRGLLDGLRVDHPDGLADPRGYLRALAAATGDRWTVVEKILGPGERLPADWPCAGTTGYDALRAIDGVLLDGAGLGTLVAAYPALTGSTGDFAAAAAAGKREAVERTFPGEVALLAELAAAACRADPALHDHTDAALRATIGALLVACPVYRVYVTADEPAGAEARGVLGAAAERAAAALPGHRAATVALVRDLALGELPGGTGTDADDALAGGVRAAAHAAAREFAVRFQQCCGAVTAKGVEDTAFYRWTPLAALNEVGGDPGDAVVSPAGFHAFCAGLAADWPATMTTLATHDAKRSADVRARLLVLAELPHEWASAVARWRGLAAPYRRDGLPDAAMEDLLWQTLVGTWQIDEARLTEYLRKAAREAKTHTSWTEPDPAYEDALCDFAAGVLGDERLRREVSGFVDTIAGYAQANSLGQQLAQLTMPGVPDVYQGTETFTYALVDPDNRRPVDFAERERLLGEIDADSEATPPELRHGPAAERSGREIADTRKLAVVAHTLRLRRARPAWFGPGASYTPVAAEGPAAAHAVAFRRGGRNDPDGEGAVTVVTRLPAGLDRAGGWRDTTLPLSPGRWRDLITERRMTVAAAGGLPLAEPLRYLPVALLVREEDEAR